MDWSFLWNLPPFKYRNSKRVQKISEDSETGSQRFWFKLQSTYWKWKNWTSPLGLGAAALLLGFWADSASEREAILKWERNYRPSAEILRFALGSRHFKLFQEPQKLQKVLRTLPTNLDETGSIWVTLDLNWAAYYSDPEQLLQPQIHCLECTQLPSQWQPFGYGWRALEKTLEKLDEQAKNQPPSPKKSTALPQDPRAILY